MVVNLSTELHCFKDLYIAVCSGQSTSQDCQTSFIAFKDLCVAVHSGSFHSCVVFNSIFFAFFPTHCCQVQMAWLWGPLGWCHSCKCILHVMMQKYFWHPSLVFYFSPTPPIKLKLGLHIGGRLLTANHLDQSEYLANQKQGVAVYYTTGRSLLWQG